MEVTKRVALEIAQHEGMVRQAYRDSVGVWTWSVGITSASGHKVNRYIDNPQPMERCIEVWLWVLEKYAADVRRAFNGRDLSEAEFAAALSFHYNTGAIERASWVKHWLRGDVATAKRAIMNWRKPAEIIPRRRAERDLFFNGVWSGDGTITEYTRLTSNHTPVWSSAIRVDITAELDELMGNDPEPEPEETPITPHKPISYQYPEQPSFWELIKQIFGGGRNV